MDAPAPKIRTHKAPERAGRKMPPRISGPRAALDGPRLTVWLPTAQRPTVWRGDLDQSWSVTFDIADAANGAGNGAGEGIGVDLVRRSPDAPPEALARFDNRELALDGLAAISAALIGEREVGPTAPPAGAANRAADPADSGWLRLAAVTLAVLIVGAVVLAAVARNRTRDAGAEVTASVVPGTSGPAVTTAEVATSVAAAPEQPVPEQPAPEQLAPDEAVPEAAAAATVMPETATPEATTARATASEAAGSADAGMAANTGMAANDGVAGAVADTLSDPVILRAMESLRSPPAPAPMAPRQLPAAAAEIAPELPAEPIPTASSGRPVRASSVLRAPGGRPAPQPAAPTGAGTAPPRSAAAGAAPRQSRSPGTGAAPPSASPAAAPRGVPRPAGSVLRRPGR